jgi:hypothetical protein
MRRELAECVQQAHDLSQRRAAGLIPVDRVKGSTNDELIETIPKVCEGKSHVAPDIAAALATRTAKG